MTSGHNLALRIPTGEGKSTVPQLAIKMMRKSRPGGKVILTQPLDGLLMQSLRSSSCKTVMLSMGGEIKDGERDGTLSHGLDFILSDECEVIVGHPESFGTPMGKFVMAELEKRGLISLIVFDEVHTCNEWSGFRGDMTRLSAAMRAYAPNAPVCLMSATVTTAELQALSKALGLSPRPVLLANSPLQPHIKFSFVKRPPNAFGVEGIEEDGEVLKPGLIQMLDRIYFDDVFSDMEAGVRPKRAIIFFRGLDTGVNKKPFAWQNPTSLELNPDRRF